MPQICATVSQPTIDAVNAQAAKERRKFSDMVRVILEEWDARNKAKNDKQK